MSDISEHRQDAFAALKERNFLAYIIGNTFFQLGKQMLVVCVGWDIYEKTHSPLALGYIGLAQVIPVFLLTLPAGHVADNHDRRKVVFASQVLMAMATLGLLLISHFNGSVTLMYLCLLLMGTGRSFNSPANAALLPQVVSEKNFTNAVTLNSITFQTASILGPSLGGLLIAYFRSATEVYLFDFLCILVFLGILAKLRTSGTKSKKEPITLESMFAGLRYVLDTKIILAAITLDLFAVLFGGAASLLPAYAKDILHVGPHGLGLLQAAPSLGAITMAFFIARKKELRDSGKLLLWAVVGFGLATIVFGVSTSFWLSCAMLFMTGLFDNISVVIRQSLVQLRTPDAMRGRVSAINYVFIGASNELGGFESGLLAQYFGPVTSVVFGGIATVLTVLGTAAYFPGIRKLDRLVEKEPETTEAVLLEKTT